MPEAAANSFIESINALLLPALTGPSPRIVYTDSLLEPTLDLLPADWPREMADSHAFAPAVSTGLAETSVVAFPPWGRHESSRDPQEVTAVQGIRPGPPGRLLLLALQHWYRRPPSLCAFNLAKTGGSGRSSREVVA
jgi:hypothetical protein